MPCAIYGDIDRYIEKEKLAHKKKCLERGTLNARPPIHSPKKQIYNELHPNKTVVPKIPNLGNGTECIKTHPSRASKVMQEPLVSMFSPPSEHTCAEQNLSIPTSL